MAIIRDIMPAFELFQPATTEDALGLLAKHGKEAWPMAGGLDQPFTDEAAGSEHRSFDLGSFLRREVCFPLQGLQGLQGFQARRYAENGCGGALQSGQQLLQIIETMRIAGDAVG